MKMQLVEWRGWGLVRLKASGPAQGAEALPR